MNVPAGVVPFFEQAARRNVTWLTSMHCQQTELRHHFVNTEVQNGVVNTFSSNWSGYDQKHGAQYAQAGWTAPTATKPPLGAYVGPPSKYYSSAWAGIGGDDGTTKPLIQSGTEHDVTSGGVASYYFWYEIYGGSTDTGSSIQVTNLPVSPGNSVGNVALWDISTGNAQLGVCNFSSNQCVTFIIPHTPTPGNSVEWIGEAPSLGGVVQALTDFGSLNFYNACWVQNFVVGGNNTCSAIGSNPNNYAIKQKTFGVLTVVAAPGSITQDSTSSSFTDNYYPPEKN